MPDTVLYPATPGPEFFDDPYPFFRRLREVDPVHWSEPVGAWILTGYEEVSSVLMDRRFSSERVPALMDQLPEAARQEMIPLTEHLSNWLAWAPPPDHKRLRGLLNVTFTPRVVENLRGGIQEKLDRMLDAAEANGGMDVISDLAFPLPFAVICELFGLPDEYHDRLKQCADCLLNFFGTSRAQADRAKLAQSSVRDLTEGLQQLIGRRQRDPREDLVSYLVSVEGERITEVEMGAMIVFFMFAGHETTTDLIGNGLLALLQNPQQLEYLREDLPGRIDAAVEEMLRYDCPIQRLWRIAAEDVELRDKQVKQGQIVMCMLGAANHDPAQFARPDEFDIHRGGNRHLAFGHGPHFCIGASLGRLEGQIAFTSLLNRFTGIRLTGDQVRRKPNLAHRRLEALPVVFG